MFYFVHTRSQLNHISWDSREESKMKRFTTWVGALAVLGMVFAVTTVNAQEAPPEAKEAPAEAAPAEAAPAEAAPAEAAPAAAEAVTCEKFMACIKSIAKATNDKPRWKKAKAESEAGKLDCNAEFGKLKAEVDALAAEGKDVAGCQ